MALLPPDTLRLVLDTMVEGVVLLDAQGRVVWFNPSAARILGAERLAGLAAGAEGWSAVREDGSDLPPDGHPAAVALREGRAQRDVVLGVRRSDGAMVWISVNAAPVTRSGATAAVVTSFSDVTASREAGLRLRSLESQLRHGQKMEAIGHLTGGIAHDFNNLLTAIITNADLLGEELRHASADARDELDDLRRAARRGADLVRKLMVFARRDSAQLSRIRLSDLLYDAARLLRRVVPESIELQTSVASDLPPIMADPAALEQVLMNLATNARDAMPAGGVLRIAAEVGHTSTAECDALGWGRPGPFVRLVISDTGHGMDPDTRERVYDPFFTTKAVGAGTGLGMSIVYGVIQQHGAHIRIDSEPGQGTRVELRFLPAEALEPVAESGADAEARGGTETILLVEDDESVRSAARRILERKGYRVVVATSGVDALQLFQVHQRDVKLVVSDVIMPRMGGVELAEVLRRTAHPPRILLMSGYMDKAGGPPTEGVALLAKPWTPAQLARRVREVLDS